MKILRPADRARIMKFTAVTFVLATLPGVLDAQQGAPRDNGGRLALSADSVPRTVAEAERQATRHVRETPNNPRRDWDAHAQGTTERTCVDTDNTSIAQSGDFIAGPFALYNATWHGGHGKLVWQPAVVSASAPATLRVSATRLDAEATARIFGGSALTYSRIGPTKFHVSDIYLPSVGRWLLIATAGTNWGCFLHTVR